MAEDFRVRVSFRNNHILRKREKLKLLQREVAELAGLNLVSYSQYETLRRFPIDRRSNLYSGVEGTVIPKGGHYSRLDILTLPRGQWGWKPCAKRVAKVLKSNLASLWPTQLLVAMACLEKPTAEAIIDADYILSFESVRDVLVFPDFDKRIVQQEIIDAVQKAVSTLSLRERHIVTSQMGMVDAPETLGVIGDRLGVSKERVRQLEVGSLRKLIGAEMDNESGER